MSGFPVPQEYQEQFKGSMSDNKGVKLPFPAPTLWWMNGNAAFKNTKEIEDARRFGGFGISKEDIEEQGIPAAQTWKLHDLTNTKGDQYAAYLCRTAWVAPIARRFAWFENEGKWRSSLNILAYLAIMDANKKFTPYGAVILSAKSFTGNALDKCFKDFATKTAELRGDTLTNFFFHPIGTWGNEVKLEEIKGKGGASSTITPPQLYIPKDGYTAEHLQQWFVPNALPEVLADMRDYKANAQEWLDDWKNRKNDKQNGNGHDVNAELAAAEDDLPF